MRAEELKYPSPDLLPLLHHSVILLPQLFDVIGHPLDHCRLIKKSSIAITLLDSLNHGPLPPHHLLLPQKGVVGRQPVLEQPQVMLLETPYLIFSQL